MKIIISILLLLIVLFIYLNYYKSYKKLNQYDKYYYINLDNRLDRKKQILQQLKKYNIPESKIKRLSATKYDLNGHIGCAFSHKRCLEDALQNNYDVVIIFEDDFLFKLSEDSINDILEELHILHGNNWDVLQLSSHHKKIKPSPYRLKPVIHATTSSGYIIQKHFYQKLINDLNQSIYKMQKEMLQHIVNNGLVKKRETPYALDQHWRHLQNKSKWFITYPYIGTQGGDAGASSIMS